MEMHAALVGDEDTECLGIDITDALHNGSSRDDEKRFVCFLFQGTYWLFDVIIFGSRSPPTVLGRCAAWLGRSTSSIFDPSRLWVEVCVDDPPLAAAGTPQVRRERLTTAVLWMAAAGFPLPWHKATRGPTVTWIGDRSHTHRRWGAD